MQRVLDLAAAIERSPGDALRLLDAFVAEQAGFPLMDAHDHATFFYWDGAATEAVYLQHWVFGLASRVEFKRIPHTDAFYLPLNLPRGARVEYKFEVFRGGRGYWTADPRNPRRAFDPFGSNSVCHAASYEEPEWVHPDPASRKGRMLDGILASAVFGGPRRYQVYIPAEARPGKEYPLLIVHDGRDFLEYARMDVLLDNLIHRHEVAPLIVCFTNGVERNREYAADPRQADFLALDLLPHLRQKLPVLTAPEFNGLMGASFGAVSSLFAASKHPGIWGQLLLQSGSFAFTDIGEHERGVMWDPIVSFVNGFREDPRPLNARVYASCGTFESLIYYNRSLVPVFQRCTSEFRFTEAPDGHNWINWRDRLREGLTFLFPGPLWLYYE
jgi:enterochelin esterase-like enzyme